MHRFCWGIVFVVTVQYYSRLCTTMHCSYGLFCWSSGDEAASSLYADTSLHERHKPDMARWLSQREGTSKRYRERERNRIRNSGGQRAEMDWRLFVYKCTFIYALLKYRNPSPGLSADMQESPGSIGVDGCYANNVPAFLTKLWTLVEDPETNHLICWSTVSQPLCFLLT